MQPEIFKSFLEKIVSNQTEVSIKDSTGQFYSGVITEYDDEVISMTIEQIETTCIVYRKNIISIQEVSDKVKATPGITYPGSSTGTNPWIAPLTFPGTGTITSPNTNPNITYRAVSGTVESFKTTNSSDGEKNPPF